MFDGPRDTRRDAENAYERSSRNRAACINAHGTRCAACDMSFAERYGVMGADFIHVHHVRPFRRRSARIDLDRRKDLVPVCPNCHAMLHTKSPQRSVKELHRLLSAGD